MLNIKEKIWNEDGSLCPIEFASFPVKDVAIILVNRNRRDLTDFLAEQIFQFNNEDNLSLDLFVVDIGSEPEGKSPYTTIEYEDKDFRGKCYAHNVGLRQAALTANYKYYWVMMNDLRFDDQPDAMTRLIRIMELNQDLGILSPTNIGTGKDYPGAAVQSGQEYRKVPVCDYLSLLMRGELVRDVGFLNPEFKYCFGAIHELSYKVYSSRKWGIAYCDVVHYNHLGGTTYGKTKNVVSRDEYLANARRFAAYYFYNTYGPDWDEKFTSLLPDDVTQRNVYSIHRGNWQRSLSPEEKAQLERKLQPVSSGNNDDLRVKSTSRPKHKNIISNTFNSIKKLVRKPDFISFSRVGNYRHAYLEPINSCPVKCIPCPVGRNILQHEPAILIDLDIASGCFYKLANELNVNTVIMGNWGEPLLHPNFPELVTLAKKAGISYVGVSTSLSVKRDMREVAEAGLSSIHVSVSGATSDIYAKSHRKGEFDLVMRNLKSLSGYVSKLKTAPIITLRWHRYRHNEFQFEEAQTMCKNLGIVFLPYYGHLGSVESLIDWSNSALEEPLKSFVKDSVFEDFVLQACNLNRNAHECRQSSQLVIDSDGSLIFCCSCYKKYKQNLPFMPLTPKEIENYKRPDSSICKICLEKGWAGYMNRPKTIEEYEGHIKIK